MHLPRVRVVMPRRVLLALAASLTLGACYDPAVRACVVTCASDGDCPGGLSCQAGLCARAGAPCGGDGGVDAPTDGGTTSGWAELSVGNQHACAITVDRTLWCWGNNDDHQLGQATPARSATPLRVDVGGPTSDWEHVSAGPRHTCATRTDGTLWCWGLNDNRQCGTATANFAAPTRVSDPPGLTGTRWTAMAPSAFATCAVRDDGTLWCFGTSVEGQLGQGAMTGTSGVPLRVGAGTDWRSIAAGMFHLCGVRGAAGQRGEIACWGYDPGEGRIGDGGQVSRYSPSPVVDDGAIDWRELSLSEYAACALDATGAVWCWGEPYHRPGWEPGTTPTRHGDGVGVDAVALGGFGGCLLDQGAVSCWGYNGEGELGIPPSGGSAAPLAIAGLGTVAEVGVGLRFACARDGSGVISCWGDGGDGQLGDGVVVDPRAPTEVLGQHHPWRQVDLGYEHTCAVTMDGVPYCWGSNYSGQIGGGSAMSAPLYATPVAVAAAGTWQRVTVGAEHSCALSDGGLATCWGNNDNGQRGAGASTIYDPVQADTTPLAQLSVGFASTCAVTAAGGARRCWGANQRTQLGTGVESGPDVLVPTTISETATGWTRLEMGAWFGCGLAGGGLHCWGENDSGQAGQASSTPHVVSPTAVADPTPGTTDSWLDLSAGAAHACGVLTSDGSSGPLYCWGSAGRGQLGSPRSDGPTASVVAGAGNWIGVDAGTGHTCGVRATGELHCWGSNDSGELGDGTTTPRAAIGASVGGFTDWVAVAAGEYATCAIRGAERRLYCWGENHRGQAGVGTSVRWTPAPVSRPQ